LIKPAATDQGGTSLLFFACALLPAVCWHVSFDLCTCLLSYFLLKGW